MPRRPMLVAGAGLGVAALVVSVVWWWTQQLDASGVVSPFAQTTPVETIDDAADDPAIWVHPRIPERSVVLGTDKKKGLAAYDLSGQLLQFLPLGAVNNVDLRQSVLWAGRSIDLAVASNRDTRSIDLVTLGADGLMAKLGSIPVTLPDVYGICITKNPAGEAEILINSKTGKTQHWGLKLEKGQPTGALLNEFLLGSQIEGCVVDDARRQLYVGEEGVGIWRFSLESPADAPVLVLGVGQALVADVEGLALVARGNASPWLLASSQGDSHFVLIETDAPFKVLGRFRVGEDVKRGIDAVHQTDGLEVITSPLGEALPRGLLVVQDGTPSKPNGTQNFKLVNWASVEAALGLSSAPQTR